MGDYGTVVLAVLGLLVIGIGAYSGLLMFARMQRSMHIEKRIKETLTLEFIEDADEEFEQVWQQKKTFSQRFFTTKNMLLMFSILMLTSAVLSMATTFSAKNVALILVVYLIGMALIMLSVMIVKNKQKKKFVEMLPVAVEYMLRTIVAGRSIIEAFKLVTDTTEGLLRATLQSIIDDVALGISLDKAIVRAGEETELSEFRYFCIIVHIHLLTGGNIASLFESLVEHLREKKMIDQRIKAISSESKASAGLMAMLPIFALLAITSMKWDYAHTLYTTSTGNTILAGCALSQILGVMFVMKITRIEV